MKSMIVLFFIIFGSLTAFYFFLITHPSKPISINSEKLTTLINDWRVSQGYQSYKQNQDLCSIAQERVLNDPQLDYHEGFLRKYSHYPSALQENLGIDYSEKEMLAGWLASPPHAKTLKKPYKYSCVYCKGNYCSQIFSNLEYGTRQLSKN